MVMPKTWFSVVALVLAVAAVAGGFEILASGSDLFGHYWELNTIFRESKYRDQPLTYDRASDFRSRG